MPLRLAFMGTPDFAVPAMRALIEAGHELVAVYTQPPRPAGRGHRAKRSPVHELAETRGIEVRTPRTLRDPSAQEAFAALRLDAAAVAAYGLLLPAPVLRAPRLGCLNVHASLLPRWRGAAPIQRALLAGDGETGITIMQMDEGLDTGPMLLAERIAIGPRATAPELHDRLAAIGGRLLVAALDGLARGTLIAQPQPTEGVTYAPKLARGEGELDWRRSAGTLDRAVRALNPAPGVWFAFAGERIKALAAEPAPASPEAVPGAVLDDRLTVACGAGALRLRRLQRAGRAPMEAAEFLRGFPIPAGTVLPCPATS